MTGDSDEFEVDLSRTTSTKGRAASGTAQCDEPVRTVLERSVMIYFAVSFPSYTRSIPNGRAKARSTKHRKRRADAQPKPRESRQTANVTCR